MMDFEISRARYYYLESAPLVGLVHPESRASLRALVAIYSGLLERISESPSEVLVRRVSLPALEKVWIVLRSAAGV